MKYEWFIGLRYLRAKRKQTFVSIITVISIAGVMVGVMALIIVLAVMNGFETNLKEKIIGTYAHIVIMKAGQEGMDHYEEMAKRIEDIQGVTSVSPFIYQQVMLSSESGVFGVVLKGIDPGRAEKVTELAHYVKAGRLQDLKTTQEGDAPGIILGVELSRHLAVTVNDHLQVVSPLGTLTPMGMMPKAKRFQVVGLFQSGMYEYDNTLAYVSIDSAQKFFTMGDRVTGLEIKSDNLYKVKDIAKEIRQRLGFPFYTKDWMEMNRNLFSALRLEKIAMFIILVLIVLVAAFNIISTLIMVVMEKNKDIAILKSMGAPSRGILKDLCHRRIGHWGRGNGPRNDPRITRRLELGKDHGFRRKLVRVQDPFERSLLYRQIAFPGEPLGCGADCLDGDPDQSPGDDLPFLEGFEARSSRGIAV